MKKILFLLLTGLMLTISPGAKANYPIDGSADLILGGSTGKFAPFYVNSNNNGKITQGDNLLIDLNLSDPLNLNKRFDFAWGAEALTGWSNSADYGRWDSEQNALVYNNSQHPAYVWLQQLYASVKWRSLFLSAGMKNNPSPLVDATLSSGDLVWSGNARSIPEVRIGFVDFQNIPFTRGWVQIDAALSYGKFFDSSWQKNHYSYASGHINTGTLWTYKRIYLRTNPSQRFHAKFGFQMTGLFGGKTQYYSDGKLWRTNDNYSGAKDFFDMLLPLNTDKEGYKTGDHKGSFDISFQYRFRDNSTLRAYTQLFWEDGSGMSKHNGLDGLWGLEYKREGRNWLNGAVVEFLDFTNQSGPLQWKPSDDPSSVLPGNTTGRDDYYNNYFYRSYTNYGMTIGTPMVMGDIFNLNGMSWLRYNRVRGIHFALTGTLTDEIEYIVKYSHRKGWGQPFSQELLTPATSDSWMIGVDWNLRVVPGLKFRAAVAADHGKLPANTFGVFVNAQYQTTFFSK
ncbi:MAG: capsule assembly Wzi family protein [Muribaculaceae bacterium]|nr:capsule assembly Wzi family protein [Muribaculaceae bacterium]